MKRTKLLAFLTLLIAVFVFSARPSLAQGAPIESLDNIIEDYNSEKYVILEKVTRSNKEIVERYIRVYEKNEGEEGYQTHGRSPERDENNTPYLLTNYIEIEGQYYKPNPKSTYYKYECRDFDYSVRNEYQVCLIALDLEKTMNPPLERLPLNTNDIEPSPMDNIYQIIKYSLDGKEVGSKIVIKSDQIDGGTLIKQLSAGAVEESIKENGYEYLIGEGLTDEYVYKDNQDFDLPYTANNQVYELKIQTCEDSKTDECPLGFVPMKKVNKAYFAW